MTLGNDRLWWCAFSGKGPGPGFDELYNGWVVHDSVSMNMPNGRSLQGALVCSGVNYGKIAHGLVVGI